MPLRGDDPRPKVPELTDAQRDDVRTIVANDARFIALTAAVIPGIRTTLAPAEVVPWQDEHQNMLGGVLTVELPGPQTIAGEWLAMAWLGRDEGSLDAPYRAIRYRATLGGVTGIRVFVDLEKSVVAGIDPDGRQLVAISGPEYLDPLPDVTRTPD